MIKLGRQGSRVLRAETNIYPRRRVQYTQTCGSDNDENYLQHHYSRGPWRRRLAVTRLARVVWGRSRVHGQVTTGIDSKVKAIIATVMTSWVMSLMAPSLVVFPSVMMVSAVACDRRGGGVVGDGGDVSKAALMMLSVVSATAEKNTATETNSGVEAIVKIVIAHHRKKPIAGSRP